MSTFDYGSLSDIFERVQAGERLGFEDGVRLYQSNDLPALGSLAQIIRRRKNGNRVFYSSNLHINHTNVCALRCQFCAFSRRRGEEGSYTLNLEEIQQAVRHALEMSQINEVHIVGGQNPDLGMDYYLKMFQMIREVSPDLYIKALAASEVYDLAVRSQLSVREVLARLKEVGLDGLPGGGAEIFAPRIRERICKEKIDATTWLGIHRTAHEIGLPTNATMLYGHIESDEDRVDHVLWLRQLQDETQGFYSFVPLAYKPKNTRMENLGEAGGSLDLKVFSVSRLLLDNIPHIKAHWSTIGLKLAQVTLSFGVDDLGGTNWNEKIMHEAGANTPTDLRRDELDHLIRSVGYEPCLVDSSYQLA